MDILLSVFKEEDPRYISRKISEKIITKVRTHPEIKKRIYVQKERKVTENNHIISISPRLVRYSTVHSMEAGYIYSGRWDKTVQPLNSLDRIRSIKNHFLFGKPWEDTIYYRKIMRAYIKKDKSWRGIQSKEDLLRFFDRIDDLHKKISNEGYKSQKELARGPNRYHRQVSVNRSEKEQKRESLIKNEIGVSIGRNGEVLLQNQGRHRLSIAQVLGIDHVPVHVIARHKQWQKVRNVISSKKSVEDIPTRYQHFLDHPDLQDIV